MPEPNIESTAVPFVPPEKGSAEWEEWLDGPRPEAGNGRGQWLRARQLRGGVDLSKPRAQSRIGAEGGGHAPRGSAADAAGLSALRHADDLRALQSIIDTAPIMSDRTRAIEAKQRILAKVEAEEREREHGPLIDLRAALDLIPEAERVAALGQLLVVSD